MDVGRSITFVVQDPAWIKRAAIGGLLLFIPIVGWLIIAGYWLRIIAQVARGNELPLPEWDDFGGDLVRGLKGFAAGLIWALPLIVLYVCVLVPLGLLGGDPGAAGIAAGGLAVGAYCLFFLGLIALLFFTPLIYSRVATTESVDAALDFGAVIAEARRNPVPLLIAVGMAYALGTLASFGCILCGVGFAVTYFLACVMLSHLYGQIRRQIDSPAESAAAEQPVV